MTRKHFEALAAVLKDHAVSARDGSRDEQHRVAWIAADVATICASFNPYFDRTRFLKACGVEEGK